MRAAHVHRTGRLLAAVALLTATGITWTSGRTQPAQPPAVIAWLTCEECTEGELDSVLALGEEATASLLEALLSGIPDSARLAIRAHLAVTYAVLLELLPQDSLPPQDRYIERFTSNFDALYRSRAALALGLIGSPQAIAGLAQAWESATVGRYRPDVRDAIQRARTVR